MQKRIINHIPIVVAITAAVITTFIAIVALTQKNNSHSRSSNERKSQQVAAIPTLFSADPPQGWRTGPSNGTSIALFGPDDACFVSTEYRRGTVDISS